MEGGPPPSAELTMLLLKPTSCEKQQKFTKNGLSKNVARHLPVLKWATLCEIVQVHFIWLDGGAGKYSQQEQVLLKKKLNFQHTSADIKVFREISKVQKVKRNKVLAKKTYFVYIWELFWTIIGAARDMANSFLKNICFSDQDLKLRTNACLWGKYLAKSEMPLEAVLLALISLIQFQRYETMLKGTKLVN